MAYRADIEIAVRGQAAVTKLQRDLEDLGQKIDSISKRRVGPGNTLQVFNAQLQEAANKLQKVVAGTTSETQAISAYVTALGNANAASVRQNNLIQEEISLRQAAEGQLDKLNKRQQEFTERTEAAARAANKQTAEFYRMQRIAKQIAELNRTASTPQLLLPAAKPGSPAMSGGARSLITGPVERAGGMRTADEAAMALRNAQALKEQVRPLSQIEALYGGIYREAVKLQSVKALPNTEMLNASVRGIKQLEIAEDRLNRERQESIQRLQQLDRLEESRARRAQKLQNIADYQKENVLPGTSPPSSPGTTRTGPRPGSLAFNPNPSQENLALGAGFPLLFGGGVGQVAGGLLGSMFGSGFGGQILGSALGQQLEDAYVRITEIGRALDTLDMDKLRDSVVTVSAQLEGQVNSLVQASNAESARAIAAAEVYKQTGLSAGAAEDILYNTTNLKNAWDAAVGSISAAAAQLINVFIPGVTAVVSLVGTVARGWAMLGSLVMDSAKGVKAWFQDLVFGEGTSEKVRQKFGGINEEAEKLKVKLTSALAAQLRSVQLGEQLLGYEKERTNNVSLMGKLINIDADRKSAIARIEADADEKKRLARLEYKNLTDAASQKELADRLQAIDAEKRQGAETANNLALRQRQVEVNNTLVAQDQVRVTLIKQQGEVAQAVANANKEVLSAQLQQLEQRRQVTTSLSQELSLISQIQTNKVATANAALEATRTELQSKVAIAAAELQSVAAQKEKGFATQEQLQTAQNTYNTVLLTSNEVLRGATATKEAATAAADFESRMSRTAAYAAQYASEAQRATQNAQVASNAYTAQLQVAQAVAQATVTINNAQIQTLQSRLGMAKTDAERLGIIRQIAELEKSSAAATLQGTYAQIRAQVESQRLALTTAQIKYKELEAVVAIARAQGTVTREHINALNAQSAAVKIAWQNYDAASRAGQAQAQGAQAVYKAAVYAAELKANMTGAADSAGRMAGALDRASSASTGGVSISGPALEPWMERSVQEAKQNAINSAMGDALTKYYAGVNAELKARQAFWAGMSARQAEAEKKAREDYYAWKPAYMVEMEKKQTATSQALSDAMQATTQRASTFGSSSSTDFSAFASGGYVTKPTIGLIGEAGEPEYIIPQSKMADAASSYLGGRRGAGVLDGSGASSGSPVVNITTGPVMQQNGENYVTVADMQAAVRQTASMIYASLRTPAGRYAIGVR